MAYDRNNVFYKILLGEIETKILLEGEYFIAFNDIVPKAPVHVLIIPKNEYVDMYDFASNALGNEIEDVMKAIPKVVDLMNLKDGGFRVIANSGRFAQQEVMHFHMHVIGDPSGSTLRSGV
jgi:diadenosine tetraphosphate (Ap4A) HIT family hydrolase